jgi:hypothetical protein
VRAQMPRKDSAQLLDLAARDIRGEHRHDGFGQTHRIDVVIGSEISRTASWNCWTRLDFPRRGGEPPSIVIEPAHQHRPLSAEMRGLFYRETVPQNVQHRAQAVIGLVMIIPAQEPH